MTIRHLKEIIKDLPDDMRVYADNGGKGMFSGSEFLCGFGATHDGECRFILQTEEDFNVAEELEAWCEYAGENDIDEQDFWTEFVEHGYKPEDFDDADRTQWAYENLKNYGLI